MDRRCQWVGYRLNKEEEEMQLVRCKRKPGASVSGCDLCTTHLGVALTVSKFVIEKEDGKLYDCELSEYLRGFVKRI